jgi:hypothetical protein
MHAADILRDSWGCKNQFITVHVKERNNYYHTFRGESTLTLGKINREPRTEPKESEPKPKEPKPKFSVPNSVPAFN